MPNFADCHLLSLSLSLPLRLSVSPFLSTDIYRAISARRRRGRPPSSGWQCCLGGFRSRWRRRKWSPLAATSKFEYQRWYRLTVVVLCDVLLRTISSMSRPSDLRASTRCQAPCNKSEVTDGTHILRNKSIVQERRYKCFVHPSADTVRRSTIESCLKVAVRPPHTRA